MYNGFIKQINFPQKSGIIYSPESEIDSIFFEFINCNKHYTELNIGDKVTFKLFSEEDLHEATEINFVGNASLDSLRIDFENEKKLFGYLRKINGEFYVKDLYYSVFIKLIIAKYELKIEEVYEKNINKVIPYKIVSFNKKNKIRAVNLERVLNDDSKYLMPGFEADGFVVDKIKHGFSVKIFDNLIGFLPLKLANRYGKNVYVGDNIRISCVSTGIEFHGIVFDLTENLVLDNKIEVEKNDFLTKIKIGSIATGKVKKSCGFGVFINLCHIEGFLHASKIFEEYKKASPEVKKLIRIFIDDYFLIDKSIDVLVEDVLEDSIILDWNQENDHFQLFRDELKLMIENKL